MSNAVLLARLRLVQRARGTGLVLRLLIVLSPMAAIVCTQMATDSRVFALDLVFLDALIVVLSVVCVVYPDGHVGIVVLALLTAKWLAGVDHHTTPWALAVAALFTVFHTSLAAASVAPPSAPWSAAMKRRWLRRASILVLASGATALMVSGASHLRLEGSDIMLAAALALLAVGGLWAAGARSSESSPRPE